MKLHQMWVDYPTIQVELNQTLKNGKCCSAENKPVEEAIKETIHAGGKLLRPAYQLLFASIWPGARSR